MHRLNSALLTVLVLLPVHVVASPNPEDLARQFLAAMGGAAWQDVRTVHNTAINHHPAARLPYIQEYWYFTEAPKQVLTIRNHDMNRKRAYTSDGGWSLAEGKLTSFSEERLNNEITSWSRSLYRKLYLLANDFHRLELSIGVGGRLEFREAGQFVGWVVLDEHGAPHRYGGTESPDHYTDFDGLMPFGDLMWPKSGQDESGWRFELLSIEASKVALPISAESP